MKLFKASIITATTATLGAVPAFAHAGPHEASFLTTVLHWLTSPTHAALAVVGSVAIIALIVKLKRT
ncbi:MAG: hypothetical protein L3J65_12360 [Robiginitomaculum sp.]|nr:hypothetical protein [Robiginitomaculum sp.]